MCGDGGVTDLSTLDADGDSTYFRFLGLLVTYPDEAAVALGLFALLLVIAFAVFLRTRQLASVPGMLIAFGTVLASLYTGPKVWVGVGLMTLTTLALTFVLPVVRRPEPAVADD